VVVLLALTAAVYLQVRRFEFLDYDDVHYVLENGPVRRGLSLAGLRWALASFHASNWHPLTWISHMADVSLFSLDPGWHHLVNLLFHLGNAALLVALLSAMLGRFLPALLTAALFALHPLHAETVAWVAERKDLLSTFLALATLLAYLRYVRRPGPARFLPVPLLFLLALLAKPMVVTLPLLLLVLDRWPLGRGHPPSPTTGRPLPALVAEKTPLFLLSLLSAGVTVAAQMSAETLPTLRDFPLPARLANAAVSLLSYLADAAWPEGLAVFYPHPADALPIPGVAGAVILLASLTAGAVAARRRLPWLLAGWLWLLASLLPVLGLVQVGYQARADRYTYLSLTGIFLALSWGAERMARERGSLRLPAGAALLALVALLSLATLRQASFWRDGVTLFSHALRVTTDNWVARYHLGHARFDREDLGTALGDLQESVRLNPSFSPSRNLLGLTLSRLGRLPEALTHHRAAVEIDPAYPEAWFNLGLALLSAGDREGALRVLASLEGLDVQWAARLRSFLAWEGK
jgi:tetratricopeptide (TPR) repeat protein